MGPLWVQGTVEASEIGRDEQVRVDSVEYGLGMVGGTEAGERNDGKRKRVVEVSDDSLEGVGLRGKGSVPSVLWVEPGKGISNKVMGAHVVCLQLVGLGEPMAHEEPTVGLS